MNFSPSFIMFSLVWRFYDKPHRNRCNPAVGVTDIQVPNPAAIGGKTTGSMSFAPVGREVVVTQERATTE
jgi:hypothetical protein